MRYEIRVLSLSSCCSCPVAVFGRYIYIARRLFTGVSLTEMNGRCRLMG